MSYIPEFPILQCSKIRLLPLVVITLSEIRPPCTTDPDRDLDFTNRQPAYITGRNFYCPSLIIRGYVLDGMTFKALALTCRSKRPEALGGLVC